jgi:hypothetical protein
MSDFSTAWTLSRQRFIDEISGLSQEQLAWRLHEQALSIGQMAVHVAGVEASFGAQLAGVTLDAEGERLRLAATEGVVNDNPFPYPDNDLTPDFVLACLDRSKAVWEPLISEATPEVREKSLKSALGPMIDGNGAFARLSFHAAYHQGQAYLYKTAPNFPR